MSFAEYWARVCDSGWCEALSEDGRLQLETRLRRAFARDPCSTSLQLWHGVYDHDALDKPNGVQRVLEAYDYVTGGALFIDTVGWRTMPRSTAVLAFRSRGVKYERELVFLYGEIEEGINGLLNTCMSDQGSPFRFYLVPSEEMVGIACVRPSSYLALRDAGYLAIEDLGEGRYGTRAVSP